MLIEIFVAALSVMMASLVGVLFVHKVAAEFLETRLAYLVSFSAGVFLVVAGALALESFHLIDSPLIAAALIAGGYLLAWLVHYLWPETHHHHDDACPKSHGGAKRLIIGDAIHNIGDGIILVPAFMASPALGVAVTASIVIHEALQEISEFFVLRRAGYSTRQALLINFAVSSTILVGVALSYFALTTVAVEGALLAVAAGFFLNVVLHDLFPSRKTHGAGSVLVEHVLILAIGVIAMASVNVLLGDMHVHGDGHDHGDEEAYDHADEHADERVDEHDADHDHVDDTNHGDHDEHTDETASEELPAERGQTSSHTEESSVEGVQ